MSNPDVDAMVRTVVVVGSLRDVNGRCEYQRRLMNGVIFESRDAACSLAAMLQIKSKLSFEKLAPCPRHSLLTLSPNVHHCT